MTRAWGRPCALLLLALLSAAALSGCGWGRLNYLESRVKYLEEMQDRRNRETLFAAKSTCQDVIDWWEFFRGRAYGLSTVEYRLDLMEPASEDDGYATYILYELSSDGKGTKVMLDVPTETWTADDWKDGKAPKCMENMSRLRTPGGTAFGEVDLNPHCSEAYGADEVNITLFWTSPGMFPLVEIVTNGPACVPAALYSYDKAAQGYRRAKWDCNG